MGQICSGDQYEKSETRDVDDKTLDPIEMKETKIEEFDAVFNDSSDCINHLVELNNNLVEALENVKEASAILQGELNLQLSIAEQNMIQMNLCRLNYDNNKLEKLSNEEVDKKFHENGQLREAYDHASEHLTKLNHILVSRSDDGTEWDIQKGRIKILKQGADDQIIRDFNKAVFKLRKQLLINVNAPGLKGALAELVKECRQKGISVKVESNEKGVPSLLCKQSDEEFELKELGERVPSRAANLAIRFYELMSATTEAVTSMPVFQEKLTKSAETSQAFVSRAPEAFINVGLGPAESFHAMANTSSNVKSISAGPQIAKAVVLAINDIGSELKEAAMIPQGA